MLLKHYQILRNILIRRGHCDYHLAILGANRYNPTNVEIIPYLSYPLKLHTHFRVSYTYREYASSRNSYFQKIYFNLSDEDTAMDFISKLEDKERSMLYKKLHDFTPENTESPGPLSRGKLRAVFLYNCLPFIGFGFLDNFLMIVAGEYIDMIFGAALGISTMAAAGLGNCISDIAGIGSATYIEKIVVKFGINTPAFTSQQLNMKQTRWTSALGKAVGVTVGCIIGMCPLLFFNNEDKSDNNKEETKEETKPK